MVALKSEQSLVPPAGGFDVTYRDHGLRLCPAGRNDDTDPVTGRVVDLDEPTLAVVERWAPMHGASGRHDVCERGRSSDTEIQRTGPPVAVGLRSVVNGRSCQAPRSCHRCALIDQPNTVS